MKLNRTLLCTLMSVPLLVACGGDGFSKSDAKKAVQRQLNYESQYFPNIKIRNIKIKSCEDLSEQYDNPMHKCEVVIAVKLPNDSNDDLERTVHFFQYPKDIEDGTWQAQTRSMRGSGSILRP